MSDTSEHAAIRAAIDHYFQGHATGDASHFHKVFMPTARIEGYRDTEYLSWGFLEYCQMFKGVPAPDEAQRRRVIDAIDVAGNAATVRATLDHVSISFVDLFVMLKLDGVWMISSKVYQGRRH